MIVSNMVFSFLVKQQTLDLCSEFDVSLRDRFQRLPLTMRTSLHASRYDTDKQGVFNTLALDISR